jgi:DNA-directed RNA polymerase I subunit RPA2
MVRPVAYDEYNVDNYPTGNNAIVCVIAYTVGHLKACQHHL